MFKGCKKEDMPPHIYATAQKCYRDLMSSKSSQSIVLSGRSGAGKTTNFKHLIHYFITVAKPVHSSLTGKYLLDLCLLVCSVGGWMGRWASVGVRVRWLGGRWVGGRTGGRVSGRVDRMAGEWVTVGVGEVSFGMGLIWAVSKGYNTKLLIYLSSFGMVIGGSGLYSNG